MANTREMFHHPREKVKVKSFRQITLFTVIESF